MKWSTLACLLVFTAVMGSAQAQDAPFGGDKDVKYAGKLWKALKKAGYVGEDARMSRPYTGQHPHGAILDTVEGKVKVGWKRLHVIVKRNYGGEGVSIANVANDPGKYLAAVTVMLKRPGYDPETKDWFWAKYLPDGSLDKNPKGMLLAGKVAKGAPKGCIACHSAAPGGDMMFLRD